MKRISMIVLGLCAVGWTGGCCHPYYSRCADWDDSCDGYQHHRLSLHKHKRHGKGQSCSADGSQDDGCCGDCCDSCCGAEDGGYSTSGSSMPVSNGAGFGPSMPMGAGNCATGNCGGGMPTGGGCASGNCGGTMDATYGGFPIDPSQGWTISPSSTSPTVLNEPIPAPPAGFSPTIAPNQSNPSSAPVPTPIPTPISSAR